MRISEKLAIKLYGNISHHTLNVFLHYHAKFKCSYIVTFDYIGQKHCASKSKYFLT